MPFSRSPILTSEGRRPELETRGGPFRHASRARRVAASGRRVSRQSLAEARLRAGLEGRRDARYDGHPGRTWREQAERHS